MDGSPQQPFRVELDFGVAYPEIVNKSVGGRLDELGVCLCVCARVCVCCAWSWTSGCRATKL